VQCASVEAILREDYHVYEDDFSDKVLVYTKWKERQEGFPGVGDQENGRRRHDAKYKCIQIIPE
jgi:hypothetical protein